MIPTFIEIVNLPQVEAQFAFLEKELESLKPLWENFSPEFSQQETEHFAAEPWTPLSPTYVRRKQQIFGSKPILRATDHLFASFTEENAADAVRRMEDDSAEFGSSDFKAMLHFAGTSRMPARDPLAEPNIDRYDTIAAEYLDDIVRNAGFN